MRSSVVDTSTIAAEKPSQVETFTALWLEELHSKPTTRLERQLVAGTSLQEGAFVIRRVIARGGLSVVYEATDTSQQSSVAIKEILCNFGGTKKSVEKNLKQILTEVSILQGLEHPNIVQYKAFFAEGSKLYLVTEFLSGCTLCDYAVKSHPLPETELLQLTLQCCSILDFLHSREVPIIHRDFTPDNLMLSNCVLKLIDFNIAQAAVTNAAPTVMGKHCFMAPEQFCGESSALSDLYQLGTTLFYLATGKDPEPLEPCDLNQLRADLSLEFRNMVRKLTDRNASNRYSSAKQVMNIVHSELSKNANEPAEVR